MKITDALTAEHRIFLSVFEQIERSLTAFTTPEEVRTMARMVERLLQDHAARESNLAYLALDHVLAEKGLLERFHSEHQEIDSALRAVPTAKTCAEARQLLQLAIKASREHFRAEETNLFPLLEKTLQPETLRELGQTWFERSTHELHG